MPATLEQIRRRHRRSEDAKIGLKSPLASQVSFDGERREIVMLVNTADVDLEDEVVVPNGCLEEKGGSMRYILANRKVFWGHDYFAPAVGFFGAGAPPTLKSKGWFVRTTIAKTPFGDDLIAMMEQGCYPAASIGFEALEARSPTSEETGKYGVHKTIIPRWHWLEYSLTHMPMNVSCQADPNAKCCGEPDENTLCLLDESLRKGVIKRKSAMMMGLRTPRHVDTGGLVIDTAAEKTIDLSERVIEID